MPDESEYQNEIKPFRLVGRDPDGPSIPPERRWWRRESIYVSDVCLAVHLSHTISTFADDRETAVAKEALYTYLRRVGHQALEHDLMRPIACVMSTGLHPPSPDLLASMRNWGSDQEWHRGSFTLYVEIPGPADEQPGRAPYKRLADLLRPKIEPLFDMPQEARTARDILAGLENRLEADPARLGHPAELIRDLLNHVKTLIDAPGQPQQDQILAPWQTKITQHAENLARGSAT
jgi:hypothetical protein